MVEWSAVLTAEENSSENSGCFFLLLPPKPPKSNHPPMERVQHMTKSAIRRASQIEVNPQAKRNLQELFVNFTLILICLLLIYIIVLLSS
ncbi:Cardiac phospholamban [Oryzias melastigma]|uniref:Phospholamban n=1 Tax=Oryzias melastigma TaxID=30732 RepID=A0A834KYS6_ORYME|nr:Cardiac phospholamban [Oryzias melastigma]